LLNALSQIVTMIFVAGISLYAISSMLEVFLGWKFAMTSVMVSLLVFCSVSVGGLPATIYSSLLQFFITLLGLAPLCFLMLERFHGLHGLSMSLPQEMQHAWKGISWFDPGSVPMDGLGLTAGLGFVLGFGYWCTDFILMQRAFAAKTPEEAINTPLLAGFGKLLFSILVVVPGLAASIVFRGDLRNFDHVLPRMMLRYYNPALLGLGVAAILASLISALSNNIAAFSAVWTHDIYRTHLVTDRKDYHYLRVGRVAAAFAACLSIGTGYFAFRYNNLMDYLQLVLALFGAPMFAILALGMFTQWATSTGALWGIICGIIAVLLHHLACDFSLLSYGSQMSADFYSAIYGFLGSITVATTISLVTKPKPAADLEGLIFQFRDASWRSIPATSIFLAGFLFLLCLILNLWLW
jgi:SSS family solute:Na+ symporter